MLPSIDPLKASLAVTGAAALGAVIYRKRQTAVDEVEARYQGGEPYATPDKQTTGLLADLKAVGLKAADKDIHTLLEVAFEKGKPIDDKQMTMEKLIGIAASLPATSKLRAKLTNVMVDGLWASLQHPPMSYLGNKYQYRQADGSYNNPMCPNMGKAGEPYARSVIPQKRLHVVRPDPGLLFDMLMARPEGKFKENPAGISSVLFYHATIIIHDIFRTNRVDPTISDTSSYLDLAPVYGSSLADQELIRTFTGGKLKPDTYFEERLLAQPPGVNVMLVFYSRFHNYVADTLLKINEGNRFSLATSDDKDPAVKKKAEEAALKKQDEDLFQTARLITGGLYINICLHDYLRGLTNAHHSATDWTLDPRIDIQKVGPFDNDGVPRGVGNQVSAEFNLLYRFHSTVSLRDEAWLNEFFQGLFPDMKKPMSELSVNELLTRLWQYEQSIPKDPSIRTFGGLERGPDGKFKDEDLVRIMKESMEDPAGAFGARNVPKALRVVEILGILQSRKWGLASLNEMRAFFGLKTHDTFEDINSDPEVADTLRSLYDHPDMVELYPGLFVEEAKARLDPGCGGCPPYTVGRAVFSDAVTLVRSDRFYTLDYNVSTLTNWGMEEVASDPETMGGSMFYKLIQRAVPGWFPYNSAHVMQPMFTKAMNYEISKQIGTDWMYSMDDPRPPPTPHIITDYDSVRKILTDQHSFKVVWSKSLNQMWKGADTTDFMLGADQPANTAQRKLVGDIIYGPADFKPLLMNYVYTKAKDFVDVESFKLDRNSSQIDIIRDVAIPANAHMLADLFCLDLKTQENPKGSMHTAELYGRVLDVRTWGFNNNDPGLAWNRRRKAGESGQILTKTTRDVIKRILVSKTPAGLIPRVLSALKFSDPTGGYRPEDGSLRWYGAGVVGELLAAGQTVDQIADIMWLTAVAGVGAPVSTYAEVMVWFLDAAHTKEWGEVQELAAKNNPEADETIRKYVVEAQRLTNAQRDVRACASATNINGKDYKPGDVVMLMLGYASRDAQFWDAADQFKSDRDPKDDIAFGFGPHQCLGREISTLFVTALVKLSAGLKNLRTATGEMGMLRKIQMGTERCYLTDDWARLTFDPTTWKLHYDGYGQGVGHHDRGKTGGLTLTTVYDNLKQADKDAADSIEILEAVTNDFRSKVNSVGSGKLGVFLGMNGQSNGSANKTATAAPTAAKGPGLIDGVVDAAREGLDRAKKVDLVGKGK